MIWLALLFLLMCAALMACVFEGAIRADVYPPEASEAPKHAPIVVAGSDLDLTDTRVNLIFAVQVLPYRAEATRYEAGLLELYVVPDAPP